MSGVLRLTSWVLYYVIMWHFGQGLGFYCPLHKYPSFPNCFPGQVDFYRWFVCLSSVRLKWAEPVNECFSCPCVYTITKNENNTPLKIANCLCWLCWRHGFYIDPLEKPTLLVYFCKIHFDYPPDHSVVEVPCKPLIWCLQANISLDNFFAIVSLL